MLYGEVVSVTCNNPLKTTTSNMLSFRVVGTAASTSEEA